MTATKLLAELQKRGVVLSTDNGNLHVRAARDALTPELKQRLREHKEELLALLRAPGRLCEDEAAQMPEDLALPALEASDSLSGVKQELDDAWEHWHAREALLAKEAANSDPTNVETQARLIQLRLKTAQAERMFYEAEQRYKALYDAPRPSENYVTLIWPADSPVPTIGGKWRRLRSGQIEASYSYEELALCLAMISQANFYEQKRIETEKEALR